MTIPNKIIDEIRDLIAALSTWDFSTIAQKNWQGRTVTADLKRVMLEYGGTFTPPPDNFFDYAECYDLEGGAGCLIEVPLWTIEAGKSDLVITIDFDNKSKSVCINDLRVP
ncbi:hypothetical protein [Pseudomonas sp. NPDC089406]|uniref:DUF7668 domain-containing protein n=1 Tax=Pseudomonas sp. NPDC089406 TaxID=3364463 RepID=UPI00384A5418